MVPSFTLLVQTPTIPASIPIANSVTSSPSFEFYVMNDFVQLDRWWPHKVVRRTPIFHFFGSNSNVLRNSLAGVLVLVAYVWARMQYFGIDAPGQYVKYSDDAEKLSTRTMCLCCQGRRPSVWPSVRRFGPGYKMPPDASRMKSPEIVH